MLRLSALAAVAVAAFAAACDDGSVGTLDGLPATAGGGAVPTSASDAGVRTGPSAAETSFRTLAPELEQACGGACHVDGKGNAPAYLALPDAYKSIKAFKGIVVKDVPTSTVLTKGRHEGPDLVDPLRSKVYAWLELEAMALASVALPSTDPFTVAPGSNTIDISKGGTGVAGVRLSFNAAMSGSVLTLTNMRITAPATEGVHVVFPIFDLLPLIGDPIRDTSFSNADQTINAGQSATLNPGLLILTSWDSTYKMKIEFTKLESGNVVGPDGGVLATSGCKSVTSFMMNAVPAVQQNGCLNCHNTGGSGNGALDLSALAANPRDDGKACNQMLAKADPANPTQSDIIQAPTGGVANHPFKNASQSYASMIEAWLVNEK
jgi:hypothetical protein